MSARNQMEKLASDWSSRTAYSYPSLTRLLGQIKSQVDVAQRALDRAPNHPSEFVPALASISSYVGQALNEVKNGLGNKIENTSDSIADNAHRYFD